MSAADGVIAAVRKLVNAKGRFHTEQNYAALVAALGAYDLAAKEQTNAPTGQQSAQHGDEHRVMRALIEDAVANHESAKGYIQLAMTYFGKALAATTAQSAQQAEPVAQPQLDTSKAVYWFGVLADCAALLDLPDDEPIPSGVLAAVERLVASQAPAPRASGATELIELLTAIRPKFGAVGSRDVEVRAQQQYIDRAIELLASPAATEASNPIYQLWDNGVQMWGDATADEYSRYNRAERRIVFASLAATEASGATDDLSRKMWDLQEFYRDSARAIEAIEECRALLAAPAAPKASGATLYVRQLDLDNPRPDKSVIASWAIDDDWNVPFCASPAATEASGAAVPDADVKDAAIVSLLESAEGMLAWCVKNVNKWSFSNYDWLSADVKKVRKFYPDASIAAAPAAPEEGKKP